MDALENPPVGRRRESEGFVRQPRWEVTEERPDGEVLINDDHGDRPRSVVRVVRSATNERVSIADRRERVCELVGEIPNRDPAEDLPVSVREARVAGAALAPELLKQLLALGHPPILPPD